MLPSRILPRLPSGSARLADIFPTWHVAATLIRIGTASSETQLGFIRPELPIVSETPTGEGWINEIKYDGYRTLIVIDRGKVRPSPETVMTGRGPIGGWSMFAASWPAKLPGSMAKWPSRTSTASPDFHALRSAIYTAPHRILFCAFDLLQFNGQDLRGHPLMGR